MNPILELILKMFARKVANKHLEKNEARNEAIARGEIPADAPKKAKGNPFKSFWSLDNEKTKMQAGVTFLFFMFITNAMDAIIFMPFMNNEEAVKIISIVEKFPPSYFVGIALTILVMAGRDMPLWTKTLLAVFSIGAGYAFNSVAALIPVIYLLQRPLLSDGTENDDIEISGSAPVAPAIKEDVIQTSLDTQLQKPQDIKIEAQKMQEEPQETVAEPQPAPPTKEELADKVKEASDDFVDPIDEFLNKS